ncbi:MAG: glycosyltransferase family 4 protein [Paracoccaceae bacterium]
MRILQICTAFGHGGIQRHVIELSQSLREEGHDVFLAGSPGPWEALIAGFDYLLLDLVNVSNEGGPALRRLSRMIVSAFRLRRYLKKQGISIIHAHESAPAIVARIASFGMKIPVVLTYHGSAPARVRYYGRVARLTAWHVITPSNRCAEELQEQAGLASRDVSVIGLGVQPAPPIDPQEVAAHRAAILGADGKLLVVIIARLAYQKGIDILVEVVRLVKAARQDIRFVVIGDGPLLEQARVWAASAGVETMLQFHGESSAPYLYLKASDLFLLTSRWEALPITIAEAFQVGLPVVAADAGGVRELVSPAVGRVLPVGDAAGLSAAVMEICGNPALRQSMSEAALTTSKEVRFSLSAAHKSIADLYNKILTRQ